MVKFVLMILAYAGYCYGQKYYDQGALKDGACMEQAVRSLILGLDSKYPKLENFTSSLETSRLLYERMLIENFDANSLKEYCKDYEQKRQMIDKCNDTDKSIIVEGFALADFVCIKRVDDFVKNLKCIQSIPESSKCRQECSRYEHESHAYLDPNHSESDMDKARHYKAADCRYLKCQTDCRRPYLDKQCGSVGSELEASSLSTTFFSERKLYEGGHQPFPAECREMIISVSMDEAVTGVTTGRPSAVTMGIPAAPIGMTMPTGTPLETGAPHAPGPILISGPNGTAPLTMQAPAATGAVTGSTMPAMPIMNMAPTGANITEGVKTGKDTVVTNSTAPAPAAGSTAAAALAAAPAGTAGPAGTTGIPAAAPAAAPASTPAPAATTTVKSGAVVPASKMYQALAAASLIAVIML